MSLQAKFNQGDKAAERLSKANEKKLLLAYSASLKEIRSQLAIAYEKYGGSFAEMNKYNRLSGLEKSISKEVAVLTSKTARTLKTGMGAVFQEAFYRTAFAIETTAQAKLGFALLSKKAIESAIQNPLDRYGAGTQKDTLGFLMRNRANQQLMIQQINQEIAQGLMQGEPYNKVAKRVKERLDIGASKALRIARTEAHRVQGVGRLKGLEQASEKGVIMKKKWVSTLDGDTRDEEFSHRDADGQEVAMDKPFEVDGEELMYPGDPAGSAGNVINCRCSHIGVIEGYSPEVRRQRVTPEELKAGVEPVIPYTNYNDWKKGRIKP